MHNYAKERLGFRRSVLGEFYGVGRSPISEVQVRFVGERGDLCLETFEQDTDAVDEVFLVGVYLAFS